MPMLPTTLRNRLFDRLSRKTMRYVDALPYKESDDLGREVYRQIRRDFFVNGSLTSRSSVSPIFAATWSLGREAILVDDHLDKLTKEAIAATLSSVNDCPYCGDMLISLVDAAEHRDTATAIFNDLENHADRGLLMDRLHWVREMATPGNPAVERETPFSQEELPEALAAMLAMSDINRFSHVVMAGSPVAAPFGSRRFKLFALRRFARELVPVQRHRVIPGEALPLLPEATLPEDLSWASSNPRLAATIAGVAAVVEREGAQVVCASTRQAISENLRQWDGSAMPLSRSWVESEVSALAEPEADIARLALLLAKASYQLDEGLTGRIRNRYTQDDFVRLLSWCSFTAARHQVANIAARRLSHYSRAA